MNTKDITTPKIFISYAWSTVEHNERVRGLADRLLADGIDVILDVYNLREGHDLIAFMERLATEKDISKVLIISDKIYSEKANARKGGVGTEVQIISSEVYGSIEQEKFIPIVFELDDGKPALPVYLKNRIYIDMSSPEKENENYERLVRNIYNKPQLKKPKLGKTPSYILDDSYQSTATVGLARTLRETVLQAKPYTAAAIEDYFHAFSGEIGKIPPSTGKTYDALEDDALRSIHDFTPARDEFVKTLDFLAGYSNTNHLAEALFSFFESLAKYMVVPLPKMGGLVPPDESIEGTQFIIHELFLHTIATLIRKSNFTVINTLLSREYHVLMSNGRPSFEHFSWLRPYFKVLESHRKSKTNLISPSAGLLKDRSSERVPFEEIMQAEFVLLLYTFINNHYLWYPLTLTFVSFGTTFPLFQRAESRRAFLGLCSLFGVDGKSKFMTKYQEASAESPLSGRIQFPAAHSRLKIEQLGNFENLDTRP